MDSIYELDLGHFSPMLAHDYMRESKQKRKDITSYYMSEKLDGVRAIYYRGKFITRQGHDIRAPEWFLKSLADATSSSGAALDGELFIGRRCFDELSGITRRKEVRDADWKRVRFMVFDVPNMIEPFEVRLEFLRTLIGIVTVHEHILVESDEHMKGKLDAVIKDGGEGLMLRERESFYEINKRSHAMLKVKLFKDHEAIVCGYESNLDGALRCLKARWVPDERYPAHGRSVFNVGTGFNVEMRRKHKIMLPQGCTITVKYFELTEMGVPRFPVFAGVKNKTIHTPTT